MLLFLRKKNLNLLDIQKQCICKLGKKQSELKLCIWCLSIFKDVYQAHLRVTSLRKGCREKAVAGLEPRITRTLPEH